MAKRIEFASCHVSGAGDNTARVTPPLGTQLAVLLSYDEIGAEKRRNGKVVYTHTVLSSNGWEVALRFSGFDFARGKVVLLDSSQESLLTLFGKQNCARVA